MGLEYNINFDKVFIGFTGNYYYENNILLGDKLTSLETK